MGAIPPALQAISERNRGQRVLLLSLPWRKGNPVLLFPVWQAAKTHQFSLWMYISSFWLRARISFSWRSQEPSPCEYSRILTSVLFLCNHHLWHILGIESLLFSFFLSFNLLCSLVFLFFPIFPKLLKNTLILVSTLDDCDSFTELWAPWTCKPPGICRDFLETFVSMVLSEAYPGGPVTTLQRPEQNHYLPSPSPPGSLSLAVVLAATWAALVVDGCLFLPWWVARPVLSTVSPPQLLVSMHRPFFSRRKFLDTN